MQVKDVMHTGVSWMTPDTPLSVIAQKMRDEDIGAVPIGEDDRLVGMVTDRDITCRAFSNGHDMSKMTARDVMSKPIIFCRTDDDLETAIEHMSKKAVRRLPVIDGNKRMVGMLALGDISSRASRDVSAEILKAVSAHHA